MSSFTPEQVADLLDIIRAANGQPTAAPSAPAIATPAAPTVNLTVDGRVSPKIRNRVRAATAAQLAADLTDPGANAFTPLARKHSYEAYYPLWSAKRTELIAGGMPKSGDLGAGKAAQKWYQDCLDSEYLRLAARDGITVDSGNGLNTMSKPMSAKTRGYTGTPADPTANMAIANVDRQARVAELKAQLAALESDGSAATITILGSAKDRKAASTRSVAQKKAGTNPYEATIAKLVREAGDEPTVVGRGLFVQEWFDKRSAVPGANKGLLASQALKACERLGIPTN